MPRSLSPMSKFDFVIVGSGFFGLTVAEQITSRTHSNVLILEKRNHIGGNAYSEIDVETGIEVHVYGSHLFHTSNKRVWEYVNKFTSFTPYIHKVKINSKNQIYSMPINMHTINQFLQKALTPNEAKSWVKEMSSELQGNPTNLEEKAISLIGRPLYEAFIQGYTKKQWQTDPAELSSSIISRLPVRYNYNDRYFDDVFEGLPTNGYGKWINEMVKNQNIEIWTDTDYFDLKSEISSSQKVIYTGPIDQYFDYSEGSLGWRTLDFETKSLPINDFQGTSVMNYADPSVPYTRIHEYKHLHPERTYPLEKTIISYEYSRFADKTDEPYYPIGTELDREILGKYRKLAELEENVFFGGRLGRYQYLDMHMAISSALLLADELIASTN
jgi:UDP-galactopyranose mutase